MPQLDSPKGHLTWPHEMLLWSYLRGGEGLAFVRIRFFLMYTFGGE